MRREQWEIMKRAARLETLDTVPMALIIDSPWIPGYLGVKHMDFYLDPEVWFQSHLKIHREFPDIIFVPSWWMEYGMAAEPSALGSKIKFWQDIPSEIKAWDDFDEIKVCLSPRFAERIDALAQRQGFIQADAYMAQLRWSDESARPGTPQEVAEAVRKELESAA